MSQYPKYILLDLGKDTYQAKKQSADASKACRWRYVLKVKKPASQTL